MNKPASQDVTMGDRHGAIVVSEQVARKYSIKENRKEITTEKPMHLFVQ